MQLAHYINGNCMKKDTIFISIAAYNEDDIINTISTAFEKAKNPENIFIGAVLQYTNNDFPDLTKFKNVNVINIVDKIGLGLGKARGMASSIYNKEEYYLQIDAHTVFKKNWDLILKENYQKLKQISDKPIISTYVPHYYVDKETNKRMTMADNENWEADYIPWSLVAKSDPCAIGMEDDEKYFRFVYGIEALNSPSHKNPNFKDWGYEEHYFISGHFLFTSGEFIKEIKYDPEIAYHEENVIALIAWTRGYRIFNVKDHVLWTRGMYAGKDTPNSWRSSYSEKDENNNSFIDKVVFGTLKNKKILTGEIIGEQGALTKELLYEYEKLANVNYKKFYEKMYEEVEKTGFKYRAAKLLYDLEKSINER